MVLGPMHHSNVGFTTNLNEWGPMQINYAFTPLAEESNSSILPIEHSHTPCKHSAEAWSARWWMASYKANTPKRHVAWSNSRAVGLLDLGKLKFDYSNKEYKKHKTTKKTISKNGRKQWTGQKRQLKNSQHLNFDWTIFSC